MDPLTLAGTAVVAVGMGVAGLGVAFLTSLDGGAREVERLRRMAHKAGFRPTPDGAWKHEGFARSVYVLWASDGSWRLAGRCPEVLPFSLRSGGSFGLNLGDEAFDSCFQVQVTRDHGAPWRCVDASARGALARLALRGTVVVEKDQVILLQERPPRRVADLTLWASEVALAASTLEERSWQEVVDEEPAVVVAAYLRELVAREPSLARDVARRVRARGGGRGDPELATEVARALRDGGALLELLPIQPNEQAVRALAEQLSDEELAEALAVAARQRGALGMSGCARVALDRTGSEVVQRGALAALETWLAPGALKMPFVEPVAVQLLLAGEGAVDREQELLRRLLKVQDAGAREAVLGVVARRGATELVPALRALQERVTGRDAKARVDQTIAQVQGRATGGTGALSLPTEGGGLAVVPDE